MMRIQFLFFVLATGFLLTGYGTGVFAQKTAAAPFGIDRRPQPAGTDLNVLLPKRVGSFEREDFPAVLKAPANEDLNVEYRSGKDSIFFGFSIPGTEKDAREAVRVTREEAVRTRLDLKGEQYEVGKTPGFFKIAAFMSWSRGGYFFYAQASSSQALERFMKAFPY